MARAQHDAIVEWGIPDASHGFLFQYPRQFADLVTEFLSAR